MTNFWLSHVPYQKINLFLDEFHRVLKSGAVVMIADNNLDEKVGGKLIKHKGDPNTYKIRTLADGSKHEILKNYFSKTDLHDMFHRFDKGFTEKDIFYGEKFWYVCYNLDNLV